MPQQKKRNIFLALIDRRLFFLLCYNSRGHGPASVHHQAVSAIAFETFDDTGVRSYETVLVVKGG